MASFDSPAVPPLAFHVDYWDRLGWKDRFAAAAYTERQYASMLRQWLARFVYTPQVLVQGRDAAVVARRRVRPAGRDAQAPGTRPRDARLAAS